MVLLKKVNNANPGDADHVGGNDWDKLSDYFNDTNVSETPRINNPTEYRSGILSIRDGSNAFNVTIKSATQTANRDYTLPQLIGNDTPATLALANVFTALQQVQLDADTLLSLYRPVSTTNSFCGIAFNARNSSNVQTNYASISSQLIANTAGTEDGKLIFYVRKAGVLTEVMNVDKNGLLTVASVSVAPTAAAQSVYTLLNTGAVVTTASTATEFTLLTYTVLANQLGVNGIVRVRVSGYLVQNQVTGTTFTWKITFGGTTLYTDATASVAQTSLNLPFILEFELGNKNVTNIQGLSGHLIIQDGTAATTGEGDISDDEVLVNANFRAATAASTKDTTTNQVLTVTMTHSVSSANVATSVQRRLIEFLPGT